MSPAQSKDLGQGGADDSANTDGDEGRLEIQEGGDEAAGGDRSATEDTAKEADATGTMLGTSIDRTGGAASDRRSYWSGLWVKDIKRHGRMVSSL